ncbi:MAG: hypothetical protein NZL89_05160, partial [Leptospiraceae bacterium]|nr:hypothetical protein [Leptospiraceae bacterium]
MSFSDQEKLFVAALVSGIAILGFLLFFDNLQEKPPATEPIGKVRYKNHIAVRKYAGRLVWFDLKKEDDLYPNDTIQTGDNSDAELLLPGNLVLTLESRSLVQLEFRGGKLLLRLAGGGVRLAQQGGGKAR